MSELGPTITELEPTATERLRALLTERGVEWRGGLPTETMVEADGLDLLGVTSLADMGNVSSGQLMRFHGVGRKCAKVAVALGARDELGAEVDG